jgi:hypothetical protein
LFVGGNLACQIFKPDPATVNSRLRYEAYPGLVKHLMVHGRNHTLHISFALVCGALTDNSDYAWHIEEGVRTNQIGWRIFGLEPAGGIEHSICQLQISCSNVELHRRKCFRLETFYSGTRCDGGESPFDSVDFSFFLLSQSRICKSLLRTDSGNNPTTPR